MTGSSRDLKSERRVEPMSEGTLNPPTWYRENFELFEKSLNGESRQKIHAVRKDAIERFSEMGFPTTRDEDWRFTNIAPVTRIPFVPVIAGDEPHGTPEDISRFTFPDFRCISLVFVDGLFAPDLSVSGNLEEGVRVESLGSALKNDGDALLGELTRHAPYSEDAMTALNTAFLRDGALVVVPAGVEVPLPVHILYLSGARNQPFLSTPRNLILAGENSRVSIVETYAGFGDHLYFTNAVSEIVLGARAVVEHDKLQQESGRSYHVGTVHVRQGRESSYVSNSISLGGAITRNTITGALGGERAECTLNGLSLATGRQLVDNHTVIDHMVPHCDSHELYKSILDGRSRGVFNGKIFVRKDAQKTDAKQTNKTLLLSDDATIDTKPQLEIFADDVKCTHGATVGQLDEEQVFYLRSRGVGLDDARDILTYAFASDIISRVHVDPLKEQLEGLLRTRLQHGRVSTDDEVLSE